MNHMTKLTVLFPNKVSKIIKSFFESKSIFRFINETVTFKELQVHHVLLAMRDLFEEVDRINLLYFLVGTSFTVQIDKEASHKNRVKVLLNRIDDFLCFL